MGHSQASIRHEPAHTHAEGLDDLNDALVGLHQLAVAAAAGGEPAAFLRDVVVVAARHTGSTHATVLLLDEQAERIRLRITLDHDNVAPLEMVAGPMMSKGLAGWVARERQAVLVQDTEQDTRWLPGPGLGDLRSAIVAPLVQGQSTVGILTLGHETPDHYNGQHLRLVDIICAQAAGVVRQSLPAEHMPRAGQSLLRPAMREVVVLSAAARGLVAAAGRIEPGIYVDEVLRALYQAMDVIVARHGGMLDGLAGGSLLALFDGTTAPQQAVHAAFDMQRAVERLCARWRDQLHLVVGGVDSGIAGGQALVGCYGIARATRVVGVVVQNAVRLRELARGGETLVAGPIAAALGSDASFSVTSLPPLRVESPALRQIFRVESAHEQTVQPSVGLQRSRW